MLRKTTKPTGDFEVKSWYFMRVSGVLILALVFIHLAFVHFIHKVATVNYNFVAIRWATATWRTFDVVMLVVALAHGVNGMRILIDDYIRPKGWRTFLLTSLYTVSALVLALGVIVMLTFKRS